MSKIRITVLEGGGVEARTWKQLGLSPVNLRWSVAPTASAAEFKQEFSNAMGDAYKRAAEKVEGTAGKERVAG